MYHSRRTQITCHYQVSTSDFLTSLVMRSSRAPFNPRTRTKLVVPRRPGSDIHGFFGGALLTLALLSYTELRVSAFLARS